MSRLSPRDASRLHSDLRAAQVNVVSSRMKWAALLKETDTVSRRGRSRGGCYGRDGWVVWNWDCCSLLSGFMWNQRGDWNGSRGYGEAKHMALVIGSVGRERFDPVAGLEFRGKVGVSRYSRSYLHTHVCSCNISSRQHRVGLCRGWSRLGAHGGLTTPVDLC